MAAGYPGTIWNPSTVTEITQAEMQRTIDELVALQETIGLLPETGPRSLSAMIRLIGSLNGERLRRIKNSRGAVNERRAMRVYPLSVFGAATSPYAAPTSTLFQPSTPNGGTVNMIKYEYTFSPPDPPLRGGGEVTQGAIVIPSNPNYIAEHPRRNSTTSFVLWTGDTSYSANTSDRSAFVLLIEREEYSGDESLET